MTELIAQLLPKTKALSELKARLPLGLNVGVSIIPPPPPNYFYIKNVSEEVGELYVSGASGKTLEYSFDKATWHELVTDDLPEIQPNQQLFLRGENETVNGLKLSCTKSFDVGGDITTLLANEGEVFDTERNVYSEMFSVDTYGANLVDAGELVLPATTANASCYFSMFKGCTSLTTAPELPATTLGEGCYTSMFEGCTSLTTAPELPATTLVSNCYNSMFKGCTHLHSITTHATTWDSSNTSNWVNSVSAQGRFYNLGSAEIPSGDSGIPSTWIIAKPSNEPMAMCRYVNENDRDLQSPNMYAGTAGEIHIFRAEDIVGYMLVSEYETISVMLEEGLELSGFKFIYERA